jgi:N utilization substance protein B
MAMRRSGREWALQILFQLDFNAAERLEPVFAAFWEEAQPKDPRAAAFAERLVTGVVAHRKELDATLKRYADNWDVGRMGGIERNVMRMAIFEMVHCPDIPPVVSINEAVDLAKYFSTSESGRFVNGILDRIRETVDRPAREAKPKQSARGGKV